MSIHKATAILLSVLLIFGLNTLALSTAWAAPQSPSNPMSTVQSADQAREDRQGSAEAETIRESPTPLAQPIGGKNSPSPLMLMGIGAVLTASAIAAVILKKARKFEE